MIAELGQLSLCLAFCLCLWQAALGLLPRGLDAYHPTRMARPAAFTVFLLLTAAGAALVSSYAQSDFSVLNVALNSSREKPFLYKIVGAWGNHEGSMLLWAWMFAAYGALAACWRGRERALIEHALVVQGAVQGGLLAFVLLTSNPFLRVWPIPLDGDDLNPILQDIGLAFHPPILYAGYVGFGMVFCFAVAALWQRRVDAAWAALLRPWILLPWSALTFGIGAGSWWAYRELGWGGWWFWDPVENVALLPWLVGSALLHAAMVLERRGQLGGWVVLLAIMAFAASLIGTFIVRSGLITSVHAFASDPARGMFILAYIVVVIGAALLLYGARRPAPMPLPRFASRGGMIMAANLLWITMAATVLIAILYPVLLTLMGAPSLSVGPTYYQRTVLPPAALLVAMAALAPLLAWDRFRLQQLTRLTVRFVPALLLAALIVAYAAPRAWLLCAAGAMLSAWLIYGTYAALRRGWRAPQHRLRSVATALAHGGVAMFVLGVTITFAGREQYDVDLHQRAVVKAGQYELRLIKAVRYQGENFMARQARFAVLHHGRRVATLAPELRYYPARNVQTSEVALYSTPLRDVYLVLGEQAVAGEGDAIGVRLMIIPAQQWVWLGFVLIGAGGLCGCLSGLRRMRA